MNDLTHIDLFSGIGGFSLAAGWAGFRTVAFCEIDKFCQEVLRARFGATPYADNGGCSSDLRETVSGGQGAPVPNPKPSGRDSGGGGLHRPLLIPNIFTLDGTRFRGATLLTGGFPCQPFSCAGKRRGKADDRAIWPEMLRVISECRPTWVIAENVSGIIRMELDQVLSDLEMEGYTARTLHIGAVAVNAPHRRMRVWIVANLCDEGLQGGQRAESSGKGQGPSRPTAKCDSDAPDAERDSKRAGLCEGGQAGEWRGRPPDLWGTPWIEVAQRFCQLDDGLPSRLVGYLGTTEAHIKVRDKNRVQKLKALGNAICWPVAYEIIRCIAEIENGNKTR